MNKKSLLLIFIISLVSVIYTINNICYQYIDKKIDNYLISKQKISIINENTQQARKIVINEHSRLLITITAAALTFAVVISANQFQTLIFIIFFIIAYFIAYKIAFDHKILINLTGTLASVAASIIFAKTYKSVFKENVDKKIENILSKYISKDIKNKVLKNESATQLGGKRAEITIMFADIRGFTALSETRKAEEVSLLLNEYFSELEPIITKYNGVINKFIGDAVLVVFGDPAEDSVSGYREKQRILSSARDLVLCILRQRSPERIKYILYRLCARRLDGCRMVRHRQYDLPARGNAQHAVPSDKDRQDQTDACCADPRGSNKARSADRPGKYGFISGVKLVLSPVLCSDPGYDPHSCYRSGGDHSRAHRNPCRRICIDGIFRRPETWNRDWRRPDRMAPCMGTV